MSLPSREYLAWYSQADLDAPGSERITRRMVTSLALIAALLIVTALLSLWIPALMESRLDASPLAKSLWVGQPNNAARILTDEKRDLLQQKIADEFSHGRPSSPAPVTIQRFCRHPLRFQEKSREPAALGPGSQEWYGRTVEAGDEILSRLTRAEAAATSAGIVPTRELLTWLGYDDRETPPTLNLRFHETQPWQSVPVAFVAEVKLPYELKFLIRRSEFDRLQEESLETEARGMQLGPVPADWPTSQALKRDEEVSAQCSDWGIRLQTQEQGGTTFYRLVDDKPGGRKRQNVWTSIAREFRELLRSRVSVPPEATILPREELVETSRPPVPAPVFELAEVRVARLNDLKPTARGCHKAQFPTDETLVAQVDQVHQVGRMLMAALVVVSLALLLIAFFVMTVIQRLRCELKTPEIGMLKALGMSSREFLFLYGRQAQILWRRALLWASPLTLSATLLLGLWTGCTVPEWLTLAGWLAGTTAIVGLATLAVIHGSLIFATHEPRTSDPMVSIRVA